MDSYYPTIQVQKLLENAILPTRGTEESAGLDLYACEDRTIYQQKRVLISTGIAMAIPQGMVGLIWPRSGLAVKGGIDRFAGVIDSDYRGEIKVLLFNSDPLNQITIHPGDRIAQLIIQRYEQFDPQWVEELESTKRGEGGFGHTGM